MKNKRIKVVYILFFIAAVFFAAFVLVEFRKDYLAVALAAIVMLIAAYFLVDKIERDIYERYDIDRQEIDEKIDEATGEIRKGNSKIDQLSEAILQASMKGLSDPKQKLSELVENLSVAEQSMKYQQDMVNKQKDKLEDAKDLSMLLSIQQETIGLIKAGFKTLIQYSKENARQVALNTNQNSEQILKELSTSIQQLMSDIPQIMEENITTVQTKVDSLSDAYLENISLVSQKLDMIEELTTKITESLHE